MTLAVKARASLEGQHFHVVIIGGGINGVAVARECARAGKRTLLVEQNDFASGVTSRSTRIIHGGLRYLEHGELGLVRESLREREQLLREAIEAGAVVRNHSEVLAVDVMHGRARGVLLRDRISGKDERIDAAWVLNCTGPWADRVCQRSSVRTAHPMLGGVRGSHIVIG